MKMNKELIIKILEVLEEGDELGVDFYDSIRDVHASTEETSLSIGLKNKGFKTSPEEVSCHIKLIENSYIKIYSHDKQNLAVLLLKGHLLLDKYNRSYKSSKKEDTHNESVFWEDFEFII